MLKRLKENMVKEQKEIGKNYEQNKNVDRR